MSTYYRLKVRFYQYNDGSSNNGHFRRTVEFDNEAEAVRVRDIIAKAITDGRATVGFPDSDENVPDYIPGCCGGYYTSVELFKVDETVSPLGKRMPI